MLYKVYMSDYVTDKNITVTVVADNVFDAISFAESQIPHPQDTELIEAIPVI